MFGEVLLRSEFVLQHFGEITHVLTRCRLRERDRQKFLCYLLQCVCVCVCERESIYFHGPLCIHKQHMHLRGGECVLLIRYLAKVFFLQMRFLPCKQTTNYHSGLTRGGENPFAEDSDNHRWTHTQTHTHTHRQIYNSHSWQICVNEQTLLSSLGLLTNPRNLRW